MKTSSRVISKRSLVTLPRGWDLDIQAADNEPHTLTLTAPVEIIAAEAPAEGEAPRKPTFKITAYTGAVMRIGAFFSPVIVDLAGVKAARATTPIFRDHDPGRIVGQADRTEIDSSGIRLEGKFTGKNADSQEILDQAADGFQWQASIGASIVRREFLEAGKKAQVNGREVTGPLVIARQSVLKETSFVALGADDKTSATVAATQPQEGRNVDPKFQAWLEAKSINPETLDEHALAALEAAWKAEAATSPHQAHLDEVLAKRKAQQQRIEKITALADKALEENPRQLEAIEALSRMAIQGEWSDERFELELLRGTRSTGMAIRRPPAPQHDSRVIEAAICMAGRLEGHEEMFDDRTLQAAHDQFRSGIGLRQLFLICAEANGYRGGYSHDVNEEVLRAAFNADGGRSIQAGFSTVDISTIISNTANKFLRMGWDSVDMTPMRIAAIRPVRDFKTITTVSLTGDLQFEQVGASGEIKHGTLGEETYTNKAETYGKILAITRQDIINDDLGALTQVPRRLGRGAGLKLNDIFWTAFLDNASFYTAARNNVNTGVADMTVGGLEATETIFMDQTDPDGKPLGVMPEILVVPTPIKSAALTLMNSQFLIDGTSTDKQGSTNIWQGRFRVESSPYMSNSSYTGYSAAAWYMLADPDELPVIEIVALNGRVEPIVETANADFNALGVQMRGYSDIGVAKQEHRAGVRADGGSS